MASAKPQHHFQKTLRFLIFSLALFTLTTTIVLTQHFFFQPSTIAETEQPQPAAEPTPPPPKPTITSASARWLVMGDIFLGRAVNSNARKSPLKTAQPFSKLDTFERANYTDWIANLECPVTNNGHNEYQEMEKLIFNCDPDYLPEMQKWFSVVSLANNHTDNQGKAGFQETQQHLSENNIQYFGTYDRYDTANICNVVKITTLIQKSDESEETAQVPFAFCGYHLVFGEIPEKSLQEIASWSAVLPVVAFPHSGIEYQTRANSTQQTAFRKMIDLGADLVIGSHPHVAQNAEIYQGKLIAYSLGNFIFDQWKAPYEPFSAVLDITLDLTTNRQNLENWTAAACATLETCQNLHLPKLTPKYTYEISASSSASRITEKSDAKTLTTIKNRLGI